jgi:CRP/FNR family transcriptional regulator
MNEAILKKLDEFYPQFDLALKQKIAEYAVLKTFKPDEELIHSGQYLKSSLLLTRGRVKLYTTGENGEEFFMYYLEPGEACALSIVCAARNKKSDLEAVATETTEAIAIPIEYLDELMINHKSWYYFVIESYRNRYQEILDALKSVAFHGMDERLEYYLVKQKNALNSNHIQLTHEQIANDLNSSRVVVSRLLKQMEHKGIVKLHRNSIELLQ